MRALRRSAFAAAVVAMTLGAIAVTLTNAEAQSRAPKPARSARPAPPKKPRAIDAGAPSTSSTDTSATSSTSGPLSGRNETSAGDTRDAKVDAGATETKTLDGGARVFRFGEVEVEARLRNPQLVYFLRRVRAEFAAGDLGHRTFMRELSETRKDPSF